MATWSRSQSQEAGGQRAISSGIKVNGSHYPARCEKVRLANKRENARIARWAEEAPSYKKVRKYNNTIEVKLSRKVRRSLVCLSSAKRAMIQLKASQRAADRAAFFAAI